MQVASAMLWFLQARLPRKTKQDQPTLLVEVALCFQLDRACKPFPLPCLLRDLNRGRAQLGLREGGQGKLANHRATAGGHEDEVRRDATALVARTSTHFSSQ